MPEEKFKYYYQYNEDGSMAARVKTSREAPDHPRQVEEARLFDNDIRDLGYDKDTKEFFRIKLDVDGRHIKSNGRVEKGRIL